MFYVVVVFFRFCFILFCFVQCKSHFFSCSFLFCNVYVWVCLCVRGSEWVKASAKSKEQFDILQGKGKDLNIFHLNPCIFWKYFSRKGLFARCIQHSVNIFSYFFGCCCCCCYCFSFHNAMVSHPSRE